ncbi:MAG: recombinase family protein [bacterium]
MKVAIYLRVSTLDQATKGNTNRDGFSIPAQREACKRKAQDLGAKSIREYVDRGESARSAARPALQLLLRDLSEKKAFDYVIVHKLDRLARNLHDDVVIGLAIQKGGAQLVSVTENIDETPSGRLLHGIMATIAEFYSGNLAAEALKGATEKAKQGGTPFQAPIGYLNVIERANRREIRTVIPDPDRAHFARFALERYATGDYTDRHLLTELTRRGFRMRATNRSPAHPISRSGLARLLCNRYYIGYVSYNGVEYKGNHQPLVTPAVFAAVQAVRLSHSGSRRKDRKHFHCLAGLLICARCNRRLCHTITKRRYSYFFCINRQHAGCTQPYIPADSLEKVVITTLNKLSFSETEHIELAQKIHEELREEQRYAEDDVKQQKQRLTKLEVAQENLLQAYYEKLVPGVLLKKDQKRIAKDIAQATEVIAEAEKRLAIITGRRDRALALAQSLDVGKAFLKANPIIRQYFCRAFFASITVDDEIADHKRGIGAWRKHQITVTKVDWHDPISIGRITEAILALSLK